MVRAGAGMRLAALTPGVLGPAGGVLAAFLLAAFGALAITVRVQVSLGPAPYRALGLGLIAAICAAVALRGVLDVGAGRADRGGLRLLVVGLLLATDPLAGLAGRGAPLGPAIVVALFLLGAATAFAAPRRAAP